jgi:hypothetical protein
MGQRRTAAATSGFAMRIIKSSRLPALGVVAFILADYRIIGADARIPLLNRLLRFAGRQAALNTALRAAGQSQRMAGALGGIDEARETLNRWPRYW